MESSLVHLLDGQDQDKSMSEQIKQDDYAFKSREPIQKEANLRPQGIAVKQMAST